MNVPQVIPGRLLFEGRLQSSTFFLCYLGLHFKKDDYLTNLRALASQYSESGVILSVEIVHSVWPYDGKPICTYVIFALSDLINTRKWSILDWDGVSPMIRILRGASQMKEARRFMAYGPKPPKPPPKRRTGPLLYRSDDPNLSSVSDLVGWQLQAFKLMNHESEKHGIVFTHLVLHREGEQERTAFLRTIAEHQPKRFLIFKNVPERHVFGRTCTQEREFGNWNGDVIIFEMVSRSYVNYPCIADRARDYAKGSVWIFRDTPFSLLNCDSVDHWRFYKVNGHGSSSDLRPITVLQAVAEYGKHRDEKRRLADEKGRLTKK